MYFRNTALEGPVIVEPAPAADERGLFARLFDADKFRDRKLPTEFAQQSTSLNRISGTLRGMHFQAAPHAEAKLVRCTKGILFDVIVDIRRESPQFGKWCGIELSADNRFSLYVPPGFAHGFQTLADDTEVFYQITQSYVPEASLGFAWNDPEVGITWPAEPTIMSDRDRILPPLSAISPMS